jgi:hypothetical protein
VRVEAERLVEETIEQADTVAEAVPATQAVIDAAATQAVIDAAARAEEDRKAAEDLLPSKKIIVEYQATDENGQPIGRPTHWKRQTGKRCLENSRKHTFKQPGRFIV